MNPTMADNADTTAQSITGTVHLPIVFTSLKLLQLCMLRYDTCLKIEMHTQLMVRTLQGYAITENRVACREGLIEFLLNVLLYSITSHHMRDLPIDIHSECTITY